MSLTQFPMVQELAFLVNDNPESRHLVLSLEDALVTYLQTEQSGNEIVELQPMNSYHRLLVHRLADIFGCTCALDYLAIHYARFGHESVGEGDARHLVLERCPETAVPSILVSDIVTEHISTFQSSTTPHQILKRDDGSTVLKIEALSPAITLKEREEAYLAARDRIFSMDEGEPTEAMRLKPKHDPVVARRMIAHALGQKVERCRLTETDSTKIEGNGQASPETIKDSSTDKNRRYTGKLGHDLDCGQSSHNNAPDCKKGSAAEKSSDVNSENDFRENARRENLGAAKRMFAHALGRPSTRKVG